MPHYYFKQTLWERNAPSVGALLKGVTLALGVCLSWTVYELSKNTEFIGDLISEKITFKYEF